jgi:3-methyladenine DNA glycosylase/8-oxoguanine DNA glycosylase
MTALEARAWLTQIDGIGKKTASILLLFCFGMPLFPIDRHVERRHPPRRPDAAEGDTRRGPRAVSWACGSPTRCTRPTST